MTQDRPAGGNRLSGKIALVTGAASGLGLAIAARFLGEGARVILTDRDESRLRERADALGEGAAAQRLDVTSEEDWRAAIAAVSQRFGELHILVNNAGICVPGTIEQTSLDQWRSTHAVNLDSVFLGCREALPLIAATCRDGTARGSILNISSVSGIIAGANLASYNSSKAAVRHLTKSIALHCAREGYPVTCNSLHPTFIDTPLLDGFAQGGERETTLAKLARQIPVGRIGQPDDVAFAAVYFCSDEASFVTGAELVIDGGITAA